MPRSSGPADDPTTSVGAADAGPQQVGTEDQTITQLQSALRELWQEISTHTQVEGRGSKGIPVTRAGDDFFTAMARVLGDAAQQGGTELQHLSEILSDDVGKAIQAAPGGIAEHILALDRTLSDQTRLLAASERMCTLLQAINMGVNAAGDALKIGAHAGGGQPAGTRGDDPAPPPAGESTTHKTVSPPPADGRTRVSPDGHGAGDGVS